MLEAATKEFIAEHNLEHVVDAVSAGTRAAPEYDNQWSESKVRHILGAAVRAGIIPRSQGRVDWNLYGSDGSYRMDTHERSRLLLVSFLRPLDAALRMVALSDAGLYWTGKRTQASYDADVGLALGVEMKHARALDEVYHANMGIVHQLNRYARVRGSFKDMFGSTEEEVYKSALERMRKEIVPAVVRKFLGIKNIQQEELVLE